MNGLAKFVDTMRYAETNITRIQAAARDMLGAVGQGSISDSDLENAVKFSALLESVVYMLDRMGQPADPGEVWTR